MKRSRKEDSPLGKELIWVRDRGRVFAGERGAWSNNVRGTKSLSFSENLCQKEEKSKEKHGKEEKAQ